MPISLNATFDGKVPVDDYTDFAPGHHIIDLISKSSIENHWQCSEPETWTDGWTITCKHNNCSLDVKMCGIEDNSWVIQIAPTYMPGLIGKILKKTPSATPEQCLNYSKLVHQALVTENIFTDIKWCWDDFPDDSNSFPEPPTTIDKP